MLFFFLRNSNSLTHIHYKYTILFYKNQFVAACESAIKMCIFFRILYSLFSIKIRIINCEKDQLTAAIILIRFMMDCVEMQQKERIN